MAEPTLADLQRQIDELRGLVTHHGANHELSGADEVRLSVKNGTTQLNRQRSLAAGSGLTATEVQGADPYINLTLTTAVPAFATPAIVLGSSAAAGVAATVIRSDGTIAAFDTTAPVTQASADVAATGSAAFAARRDHKHGMPTIGADDVQYLAAGTGTGAVPVSVYPSIAVAASATPDTFGSWTQLVANVGTGRILLALIIATSHSNFDEEIELGEGGAGSESAIWRHSWYAENAWTLQTFPIQKRLTASARLSARLRNNGTVAAIQVNPIYV